MLSGRYYQVGNKITVLFVNICTGKVGGLVRNVKQDFCTYGV